MVNIRTKIKSLPQNPGVYLFKNAAGGVLYVGKAKNLRNRVKSYFSQKHDFQARTQNLVASIADLEYIICDTETEALMLENNLIKKYLPHFNVLLKDDKNFQFIKIDYETEIPQIYTTRKIDEKSTVRPLPSPPLPTSPRLRWAGARGGKNSGIPQIYTVRKIDSTPHISEPIRLAQGKLREESHTRSFAKLRMTKQEKLPTTNYQLHANKYFGPYTSGKSVRATLHLLRRIIPYCSNKKIGLRPCFYYHLGRCPGVCAGIISLEDYRNTLEDIKRFLRGDFLYLLSGLKNHMRQASDSRRYERAAALRDQIWALQHLLERQKIVSANRESFDTVAQFSAGSLAAVNLFQIRGGELLGQENFLLENVKGAGSEEILKTFLERYYLEASDIPAEIDIPYLTPALSQMGEGASGSPLRVRRGVRGEVASEKSRRKDTAYLNQLAKLLSENSGKSVKFAAPSRGRKRKLIKMGEKNARDFLEKTSQNLAKEQAALTRALFELKDKLRLPELPLRIECFDISNIQGTSATGSMVVFENGKPKKSDYKRFAVRAPATPNDTGMMREVLSRRFSHAEYNSSQPPLYKRGGANRNSPLKVRGDRGVMKNSGIKDVSWRLPDLIVVDGGRPQLNTALAVLRDKHLKTIPVIGLAKRLEEIYIPEQKSALRLPADSAALRLLQRLRDEAHRFAISYHRKKRSKIMLQ